MAIDSKAFRSLSYGLYIVTSRDGDRLNGQIANAVFQVTSKPPQLAVCLNKENLTHEFVAKSGVFAVSVLDESAPMPFIGLFGFKSGREVDKLSQVTYRLGETGAPLVTDHAVAVMEAKVVKSMDVGTHTLFVGEVVGGEVVGGGHPMTYAYYHQVKGGKSPRKAPTYQEESSEPQASVSKGKKYICNVCGYIYDPAKGDPENGVPPGTPFEALPEDWVCPVCGAGKENFAPQG